MTQGPAKWLVAVAAITLLAVFSWPTVAIVAVSVAAFVGFNHFRSRSPGFGSKCLKCGEPMKPTERWCRGCGGVSGIVR